MTAPAYLHLPGSVDDRSTVLLAYDFTAPSSYVTVNTADVELAVTRAGDTATRINSAGVLETVLANTARFNYDPVTLACKGLLVEGARTNSIRNNTMVGAAVGTPGTIPTSWTRTTPPTGVTFSVEAVGVVNGISYMDVRWVGTPSTGAFMSISFEATTQIAATPNSVWSDSLYLALVGGSTTNLSNLLLVIRNNNAAGTSLSQFITSNVMSSVNSTLTRYTVSTTASTFSHVDTAFVVPYLQMQITSGLAIDLTLRIGMPQLELGEFPTSVIPTSSAAVTRNADVPTVPDTSGFVNSTEGSIVAIADVVGIDTVSSQQVCALTDGTANERIAFRLNQGSNAAYLVSDGGSFQAFISSGSNSLVERTLAACYKVDDFAFYRDGTQVGTDSVGTLPAVTQLDIGHQAGGNHLNGHIQEFIYFPKRLANATLESISADGATIVYNNPTPTRRRQVLGLSEIPNDTPSGLRRFLTKMKETFEVRTAQVGSPLDANPTYRDLITAGLIRVDPNAPLTASGREFTLDTSTWITSNIPAWVTDNTNPPVPTGLTAFANTANLTLVWDTPVFANYSQTLVYRSATDDLSQAELIGSNSGNTYVDDLPPQGTPYWYWIRHESKNQLLSDFNDVSGTSTTNTPAAPTVSHTFSGDQLVISWTTPTSSLAIQYYIISYGAVAGQTVVGISQSSSFRVTADFGGARTYWSQAVDINGGLGIAGSTAVNVVSPGAPTVSQTIVNGSVALSYSSTPGSLPIARYEVRHGASWAAGTPLGSSSATRVELAINWEGDRTFHVGAYDTAGNLSTTTASVFAPSGAVASSLTAQVVDNNVLLRWSATAGTLPIATFNVYRNSVLVGSDPALFSVLFETASGSYEYEIEPIDTAGNAGTSVSTTAVVSQPPDFVLYDNQDSTFSGTATIGYFDADDSTYYTNVDPDETYEDHFTTRGWTTPQDQIDAGYPGFLVGKTVGSYEEEVDYGVTIPSTKITMSPTAAYTSGTVTQTPTLSTSPDGMAYTDYPGVWSVYASAFQYVKFKIDFAAVANGTGLADDTSDLLGIKPLSYILDVKLKTAQGVVTCDSTDVAGTAVDISSWAFIDVHAIVVTPLSTVARIAAYDFVDAPNPTEFKAFLWDTSGVRQSGDASWTVRGV
jgi:hypothetical protein